MDPYQVLGVSRDADEETIKKAYRTLIKKYHPDRYVNTPMQDMASEKTKEINEAYDMLTNKNNNNQGYSGGYNSYNQGSYSTVSFQSVRVLITMRRYTEAEAMLSKLPRNAEWYYLMGVIYLNRGYFSKGMEYINKAIEMEPNNPEYRQAANNYSANSQGNYRNVVFSNDTIPCSICSSLCLTCLCSRFVCCC